MMAGTVSLIVTALLQGAPAPVVVVPDEVKAAGGSPSKAALVDAVASLLGPCTKEMADGKVTAVKVIDGKVLNEIQAKGKSKQPKANPAALFMVVDYQSPAGMGSDYRQVSTAYHLTTEQAQVLVGEKVCVFRKP